MKLIDFSKGMAFYQRLAKREKIILYITLFFLTMVGLDLVVVGPIYRSIHALNQKTRELENSIKTSILLLGQKDKMIKEAENYKSYAVSAKPAEEQDRLLQKQITELASLASVNLLSLKSAGGGTEAKGANVYKLSFECEGQMDQLVNFFYAIENSKLLLRIEKYSLQPTAKGSSVIKCSATVSMAGIS